ncbi:thiamine/thiamine pyrophosphate ABC transporter, permease protein [Enterovibrio norvegicus]|uniref:thiamine/thiamine pyrophosphate ABC transporter permease n=1 Tax=Enterovibrio norvegicus TaxID=188144 RepID=UPI000C868578|nr:thiamine/thiamine pyrophosphate ABC transporter permease [Enterovibrio norvegicus]MCC4799106.1 thiamine/thiamine pyrophosphate ABC transporter permease [Enterovibrio norvegicus]PMI34229.1 thiamine/thiamine pyrophosphate ABC transporter, permease protein [Enterovibrio norvegicus]PMI41833.1 thiamine/thiamine pyrophosphate ABC transporter, permease protein [Enterovibrio norvegicus]PMN53808.1 thiamine/thiamine pyrophosphate ABC transporter, permease protein [Enterovibrio norvegicus]TKF30868.1 t
MLTPSRTWPGLVSASLIAVLISAALFSLLSQAPSLNIASLWQDPYLQHVTVFSLKQAFFSTLLSVGLAIPIAHALSRRTFVGKTLLLKLFSMTLVLPVLVGVFGILAIYGKSGWLANALPAIGMTWDINIYGLSGILLAHVFFNLPFSVQLLVQALDQIPSDQRRLAQQLGMRGWSQFTLLEWPYLRQQLPHAIGLVFMLCFTSFATVMALGGGPSATTIELAIYQAIRFDFDLQTGALLALWQLLLCGFFHILIQRLTKPIAQQGKDSNISLPPRLDSIAEKVWDGVWICAAVLLVIPPLLMVILSGLNPSALAILTESAIWHATANSLLLASSSALSAFALGATIVLTSRYWRLFGKRSQADGIEMTASLVLVVPSVVLSTGLFLMLREHVDVFSSAYWLVLAVNTLMALPYVVKVLSQPAYQLAQQYHVLCSSLGIKGINRLRLIEWRALKAPIARALAISFVLSTGDLGAVALVGGRGFETLPLYLFRLMGSYQMDAAAAASLILFAVSLGSYALIEKVITRNAHVQG